MPFGASVLAGAGARFRLWAPAARSVELLLDDGAAERSLALVPGAQGWYECTDRAVRPGCRYRFRIDAHTLVPDPASRHNPEDVHGPSEVIDPAAFDWQDTHWHGRPWEEAVLYELHTGTFSPEGTFRGAESRLDYLAALGVTAVELMPLADFPGRWGWGYDGVLPFAPESSYGRPEELKRLVQSAHERGLMVLLDVVYNHFGPEGNYLHLYAPQFFTKRHRTPWGEAINFDGPGSGTVRDFFIHNALYWLEEFHLDGLRLDAVHAIQDDSNPDFLSELARSVRQGPGRDREIHLLIENDLNSVRRLERDPFRRPRQYTAQWNDDFHHAAHTLVTGEQDGYYAEYPLDSAAALARCLAEGFFQQGETSSFRGRRRGEPSAHLPPGAFVIFFQNHDQVGNRAFGERLVQLADPKALAAMVAILVLAPSPPMLFMGEEFGAATPFLFFSDFSGELAKAAREGRLREFSRFARFRDSGAAARIPDPLERQTFERSKLDWSTLGEAPHREWLERYRSLLALRRREIVPLLAHIAGGSANYRRMGQRALEVQWRLEDARTLVLQANLGPCAERADGARGGRLIYSSGGQAPSDSLEPWSVSWRLLQAA